MKNNFNQSSSGINLEMELYYDEDYGRITFDDLFKNIHDNVYFYTDYMDHVFDEYDPSELSSITIRGYSQGDVAIIYYPTDVNIDVDYVHNVFYDYPVYCEIVINDNTYEIDDVHMCYINDIDDIKKIIIKRVSNIADMKYPNQRHTLMLELGKVLDKFDDVEGYC